MAHSPPQQKSKAIHRPVAQAAVDALVAIFGQGHHADKVIERTLKSTRSFGARDRRFLAETIYDMVRHWRWIWAALDREPRLEPEDLWRALGAWLMLSEDGTKPDWRELRDLNAADLRQRADRLRSQPAIRESVPDWLFARGASEIGAETWEKWLGELNRQAPVILRANRLRTNRTDLARALLTEGIETVPADPAPDALRLVERKNVFVTEAFKKGLFEVQDGASQFVAPLLDPQPGDRVIDACAGAGGKSLHLAALMKNKGKILSLDIHPRKLEELRKRAARDGADIIETRVIESNKTIKRLENAADRLLLDVPCSGMGVLRRNPDTKWKLTSSELDELSKLQTHLLDSYSRMLKPGGRLVYATCSILPSENQNQVAAFLKRHEGRYRLIEDHTFAPGAHGFDGFYAAVIQKLD
ncbi:MAG: methyltransferase domain-containing protein [Bdellovibrionaceae bacterium]|nr:methyltransferase domain-containing protein [Pseudobdellovibrionaceae bacterium]